MSFAMIVYIISITEGISNIFVVLSIVLTISYLTMTAWASISNSENEYLFRHNPELKKKFIHWPIVAAMLCCFISAVVPSKNDAYLIAGAYAAEKVYDSSIGQDVIALVQAKIKQQLEEIQQPKK